MDFDKNVFQDRSWMADMIELVARKAPQFMKTGGGSSGGGYKPRKATTAKPYSAKEKELIFAMAKSGQHSALDIGKKIGRNPTHVRNLLKKHGVAIADFRVRYTEIQREQIAAMAKAGICCVDIARRMKRNQASVRDLVINMGIKPCDGRLLGRNRKAA